MADGKCETDQMNSEHISTEKNGNACVKES